jgi:hypothetical protein
MPAHALRKQFLPAVAVFRERRVGVLFFQRGRLESFLLVAVIDASGRSVEEALGPMLYRRLQHVCIDQNRQHAECFVRLNEAHPAFGCPFAVLFEVQIDRKIFNSSNC